MDLIAVVEGVTGIIGVMKIRDIIKYMSNQIIEKRKPVRKLTRCEAIINDILESICIYIYYINIVIY